MGKKNMQRYGASFRNRVVQKIFDQQDRLEDWFLEKQSLCVVPPYTSVDIRDAGFKAVPVDSNVFPAGFNNICLEDWSVAAQGLSQSLARFQVQEGHIYILAKPYGKNIFYLENLYCLESILSLAGKSVTLVMDQREKRESLSTKKGRQIVVEPLLVKGDALYVGEKKVHSEDLFLLNDDLSTGIPSSLSLCPCPVVPHVEMGWHRRKKSLHLECYNRLIKEFSSLLDIDPFFFSVRFDSLDGIDFAAGKNIDALSKKTQDVLDAIAKDYKEHGVDAQPFVFLKANSGTHGRSIMVVDCAQEVLEMSRRSKNKMHTQQDGIHVESIVIMEGVPTEIQENSWNAEPVIYLAGCNPVGGFLRMHPSRSSKENLNSPGAHFKSLCFQNMHAAQDPQIAILERFYGTLGRISSLANGLEMV